VLAKELDEITETDLQGLVHVQAPESFRLEFKRQPNLATTVEKAELAKDVSAMANTSGGRIVYGMDEITLPDGSSVAGALVPLTDGTLQEAMENIIVTAIQPSVRFRMKKVEMAGGFALVVEVYPSYDRDLHMVTAYREGRFYRRGEQRTVRMTEPEIRQAYARIAVAVQGIDAVLEQCVASELGHAERLHESVMVIPIFGHRRLVQPQRFGAHFAQQLANGPINFSQWHSPVFAMRISSDGYRAWLPEDRELREAKVYAAILRNGIVHLAEELDQDQQTHDRRLAASATLETLLTAMVMAKEVFNRAGYWGSIRVIHTLKCDNKTAVDDLVGDRRRFPGNTRGLIAVGQYRH
jgi:hypothetical protein